jgi:hypothetical protein
MMYNNRNIPFYITIVLTVHKARQARPEHKVRQEQLELLDQRDHRVLLVLPEHKVQQAKLELLVLLELLEHKVYRVHLETKVHLDPQAHQILWSQSM